MRCMQKIKEIENVYDYLVDNGCVVNKKEHQDKSAGVTHYCMMGKLGGRFKVSDGLYKRFLTQCGDDVSNGQPFYFSERKSEHFAMFYDFDLLRKVIMSPVAMAIIIRLIQVDMKRYFAPILKQKEQANMTDTLTNDKLMAIVCVSDIKKTIVSGNELYKSGIHIIFPNVVVNRELALQFRHTLVLALECVENSLTGLNTNMLKILFDDVNESWVGSLMFQQTTNQLAPPKDLWIKFLSSNFPSRTENGGNEWKEVVDEQVFEENGLRMLYANNAKSCPEDHQKGVFCKHCKDEKKIDARRPYSVGYVYDCDSNIMRGAQGYLKSNKYAAIRETSIRRANGTPTVKQYKIQDGVSVFDFDEYSRRKFNKRKFAGNADDPNAKRSSKYISLNDIRSLLIIKIINTKTDAKYNRLVLKTVVYDQTREIPRYLVNVSGDNAKFCHNKSGLHGGSSIYFEVTPGGVFQRCFSKKRPSNVPEICFCNRYSNNETILLKEEVEILFGAQETVTHAIPELALTGSSFRIGVKKFRDSMKKTLGVNMEELKRTNSIISTCYKNN